MASSLFQSLGGSMMPGPFGSIGEFLNRFNQFKNTYNGQNPQQVVQGMLQSGKMSKEEFDKLASMANTLRPMLK